MFFSREYEDIKLDLLLHTFISSILDHSNKFGVLKDTISSLNGRNRNKMVQNIE